MGSITPAPTAENRAAFTLGVVQTAAPTAVKYVAWRQHPTAEKRAAFTPAVA